MITATQQLTDEEFAAFRDLIYREAGISLSPAKRTLVASRLAKRLRQLNMDSYAEYYEFVVREGNRSDEHQQMINCITTNKTEFFREPHHFDYLRQRLIPQMAANPVRRTLRIWSAGCSTGEEPYTIAITVLEALGVSHDWDVRILASDIDTEVLAKAEAGMYPLESLETLSESIKRKYFLRGSGSLNGMCRVRPEVQRMIDFRRINLIEDSWPLRTTFDMVFCRNVLIYFDRPTQERLVQRFSDRLNPEGHLFLGHSENVAWLATHLAALGNTIYRLRPGARGTPKPTAVMMSSLADVPRKLPPSAPAVVRMERPVTAGEVYVTNKPAVIHARIDRGVSACVYDPEAGVGGMNHILLPGGSSQDPTQFGVPAMERLVAETVRIGGNRSRLRAKLVGAPELESHSAEARDTGRQIAEFIRQWMTEARIPIEGERLGGKQPLDVRFFPQTGRVRLEPATMPDQAAPNQD
ncbi:MAG: hypothetical protein IT428_22895 [Planctomycetaceae bacterium]|nr:hypothetical protein [Planctomycetaceae bacterium]